jgi:hypothetical protein
MTPPELLGTIPQWITAGGIVTVIVAYWRRGVALKGLQNTDAANIRDHYAREVAALRDELRICEEECADRLDLADQRLKKLDRELWGEKRQRVAEQISLINVVVASVDAPELKAILKSLESVQMAMRLQQQSGDGK